MHAEHTGLRRRAPIAPVASAAKTARRGVADGGFVKVLARPPRLQDQPLHEGGEAGEGGTHGRRLQHVQVVAPAPLACAESFGLEQDVG